MSLHTFTRAAIIAAGLFASNAYAAFNATASTNVAIYWGQGSSQAPLLEVCNDPSVDIVNLAFVNQFPKAVGDYPGTDFGNACWADVYTQPDGNASALKSQCLGIEPGIKACQANGKKVLLSVGGGAPTDYYLQKIAIAEYFAEFLWGAFGPKTAAWVDAGKPRPFGDAVVDGFDLDIESYMASPPFAQYLWGNYNVLVTRLRTLYATVSGTYYISAAPQCIVPDAHLADAITKVAFDFIFAQFYNTAECNTRAGVNGLSTFTFTKWVDWLKTNSKNKNVKLYMGMPGGIAGAPNDPQSILTIQEANTFLTKYSKLHPDMFGGAMLWEYTASASNIKCGRSYSSWIKDILVGKFITDVCPVSTSISTSTSTSTAKPTTLATSTKTSTPGSTTTLVTSTRTSTAGSTTTLVVSTKTSTAPSSSPTNKISTDGQCGTNGLTCLGTSFGNCCSSSNWCGSSDAHCGTGCQSGFGNCGIVSPTTTTSAPTPGATQIISTDATCGSTGGFTCQGSAFGNCCSSAGW
ncbi:carbohydrate-binding module family 18 protein [Pleomassaria siparia CBS 279.74]|uniref:chitinase n=1 Tax=Pleomassaria siparia CBS 279.74 TaxID=1314801 RepID=A0A6G1KPN9_9PLEO|nr:carbohydrate-binding module family 18 protein [Pleomassaria siparia CBS 279.74]